jgi:hypothetical protein
MQLKDEQMAAAGAPEELAFQIRLPSEKLKVLPEIFPPMLTMVWKTGLEAVAVNLDHWLLNTAKLFIPYFNKGLAERTLKSPFKVKVPIAHVNSGASG